MLLTTLTNRALQAGLAAAVLGSLFLFACGSDETTPRTPITSNGGTAQSTTGNTNSSVDSTNDSTDGQGGSGNASGETKGTSAASTAQGGTGNGTTSNSADAPACAASVRSNTECVTGTDLPCSRDDGRICTCVEDAWSCPRSGTGSGGAGSTGSPQGGSSGANNCSGVDTGDDCSEFAPGAECDRSDSASNPRVCTCGDNEEWTCVPLDGGAGGSNNSSEPAAVAGRRGFGTSAAATAGRRGFGTSAASASGGAGDDTSADTATGARRNTGMGPGDTSAGGAVAE